MTTKELAVARETFNRMQAAIRELGITDLLLLKAAYAGAARFDQLSDKIKEGFAKVGKASEGIFPCNWCDNVATSTRAGKFACLNHRSHLPGI